MITFRNLYPDELEKWFDFLVENIFVDDKKELFCNQWYCDPHKDINGIFVAVDDNGHFLSTLRVFIREIYINGISISCAGIGSVGTKAEYRGKKLSTTLFEKSFKYMEDRNIKVSYLLCGDHNEKYYNKQGYSKSTLIKKISRIDKCTDCSCDYYVRDVNFENDITALSNIYLKFSGEFNGSIVRSMEYWKEWIPSHIDYNYKIVSDSTGKNIAYICFGVGEQYVYIVDFGCLPEHINIFDSLIEKISSDIIGDNLKIVYQMNIISNMKVDKYWEACCAMYKLMAPFSLGSLKVDSTEKLLEVLKGDGVVSKLLLWDVDDV